MDPTKKKLICEQCKKTFVKNYGLKRHLKENRCKGTIFLENKINSLEKQISKLKEKSLPVQLLEKMAKDIEELKGKPNITNNNLQVICVGNKDNYLDMLTERLGDFDRALECIKDCALSNLTGDCNLIEKIYFNHTQGAICPIRSMDKNRNYFEYYNEKKEKIVENHENFGRKIANNLQNSYLKGVNYLINQNLENRRCPNKFLEEYDLQIWNQHIYDLSDPRYQRKIVNNLNLSYT